MFHLAEVGEIQHNMEIHQVAFSDILDIWKIQLWPGRKSPIESHSAMLMPPLDHSMKNFQLPVYFYGAFENDTLVGVNSAHGCADGSLRSRGLWVNPQFRGRGIGEALLRVVIDNPAYLIVWSFPRSSAWPVYEKCGFKKISDWMPSETSEANAYCSLLKL